MLEDEEADTAETARASLRQIPLDEITAFLDAVTALNWAARAVEGENPDAFSLGLLADAQWRAAHENEARITLAQALARDPGNRTLLRLEQRFGTARR